MSVKSTLTALRNLHAGISGITSAPTSLPGALNSADLPLVLVTPGAGEWRQHAVGLIRQQRTYVVQVFVAPVAHGVGVDEGFQKCPPLLQAFGELYAAADFAERLGVDQVASVRDLGVGVLTYAGVAYHGFTFNLEIVEK